MDLFHNVLHLVLLALNLSILDVGILIMVQQVSLMMFSLAMVDLPMSFLLRNFVYAYWVKGDCLFHSYFMGPHPSCLNVKGWVGGLHNLSVSPSPFGINWTYLDLIGEGVGFFWGIGIWD